MKTDNLKLKVQKTKFAHGNTDRRKSVSKVEKINQDIQKCVSKLKLDLTEANFKLESKDSTPKKNYPQWHISPWTMISLLNIQSNFKF
jgi:flagellar hook-length control protein FliK